MRLSTTFVFLLLFGAVTWFYFKMNMLDSAKPGLQPIPAAKTAEEIRSLIPLKEGERINWFQIQHREKSRTLVFVLKDGQWYLKYPVEYRANGTAVEQILGRLRYAKRMRELRPEGPWSEYGLDRPSLKIGIETTEAPGRYYLSFGDKAAIGELLFARWEHEDVYFLVEADIEKIFERSVYSLREKKIFRMSPSEMMRIHVVLEGEDYEIRKEGREWSWSLPRPIAGTAVSHDRMEEIFAEVKELFIKEFLDDLEERSAAESFSDVKNFVHVGGREKAEERLEIGKEFEQRDAYYARLSDEGVPFLIARRNLRNLIETFAAAASEAAIESEMVPELSSREARAGS